MLPGCRLNKWRNRDFMLPSYQWWLPFSCHPKGLLLLEYLQLTFTIRLYSCIAHFHFCWQDGHCLKCLLSFWRTNNNGGCIYWPLLNGFPDSLRNNAGAQLGQMILLKRAHVIVHLTSCSQVWLQILDRSIFAQHSPHNANNIKMLTGAYIYSHMKWSWV